MKFLRAVFVIVCLMGSGFYAQAYEKGDVSVSLAALFSPLDLGTAWGEIYTDDQTASLHHDSKLGKPGIGGELQALYYINPRLGVGVSFTDQYFSKDLASGWYVNTQTRMRNVMAVGHILLTPQHAYKLYIPLGVGLAHTDFAMDFTSIGATKQHFRYDGFAYYVGLGVEKEVFSHFSVGLEARYNGNRFHNSQVLTNGHRIAVYHKANFATVLLRGIYTF